MTTQLFLWILITSTVTVIIIYDIIVGSKKHPRNKHPRDHHIINIGTEHEIFYIPGDGDKNKKNYESEN